VTTRADVVAEARTWIGTPWVHQASLKGVGCDCIGFPVGVGAELGLPEAAHWKADLRFRNYGRLPLPDKLLESCGDYLDQIPIADAGLGDVLLLTFATQPMHFAIVSALGPMYMTHAYLPAGGVVEHIVDEKWRRRILRAFRLRGVE
jgi:NlpC/P60 family putative phage cell wall peptidase